LSVEYRRGHRASEVGKNLQILGAGVQHLDQRAIVQQVQQRRQIIQCQWIDTGQPSGNPDLYQTQPRIVTLLPNELRVEGEPGISPDRRAETLQLIGLIDVLEVPLLLLRR
jgi:hypothetical protein